jgi:hypothetical protein
MSRRRAAEAAMKALYELRGKRDREDCTTFALRLR